LPADELAEEIYQRLRAWRRMAAEAAGRAPFEVLAEETLRAVAERQPRALMELLSLPGLTPEQVESCGEAILEVVMSAIAAGREPAVSRT
jgi:ribonuclease D